MHEPPAKNAPVCRFHTCRRSRRSTEKSVGSSPRRRRSLASVKCPPITATRRMKSQRLMPSKEKTPKTRSKTTSMRISSTTTTTTRTERGGSGETRGNEKGKIAGKLYLYSLNSVYFPLDFSLSLPFSFPRVLPLSPLAERGVG